MVVLGLDTMDAHLDPVLGMGHHFSHWYGAGGMWLRTVKKLCHTC